MQTYSQRRALYPIYIFAKYNYYSRNKNKLTVLQLSLINDIVFSLYYNEPF